jgi:NAD(P)-dependent dehydrogenase (short-subunit alcohol dehydrogenase family)
MQAAALFRPGLLDGTTIVVAGGEALAPPLEALGAEVRRMAVDPLGDEPPSEGGGRVLVWDGGAAYSAAGGVDAARAALDGAWLAIRAVVGPEPDGQKVILVAPAAGDAHAAAARAGLENLARTLSTEWGRFGVTTCAILPGAASASGDVAALVAYLASRAGDYVSGTALTLR